MFIKSGLTNGVAPGRTLVHQDGPCQCLADFFRQDGINTPRTWWRVFKHLWFKPGMMRRIFLPYLNFYRPGFHPWDHNDRPLIREFEQRLRLANPMVE